MALLKITLTKSYAGSTQKQRRVAQALGLHHMHQSVVHQDSPTILGMINKVSHMVRVEPATETDMATSSS